MVRETSDLRAFCLVVDLGSITRAARLLGESKATVSRRITRLEASLGLALVERTSRRVQATENGEAYRERVGEVLDLLGAANDAARGTNAAPAGKLRVTSGPEFNTLLAPLVVAFSEKHPAVKVEMVITQTAVDLDREGVDVALRVAMGLPDSSLIARRLLELRPVAVASPAYVRTHKVVRTPADLTRHRTAFVRPRFGEPVAFRHRESGRVKRVAIQPDFVASDMNFVVEVAMAGGGLAFVPELAVRRELASGALVRLLPGYDVAGASLYLLHRQSRFLSPKVRVFRDFIVDAVSSVQARGVRAVENFLTK